MKIKIKSVGVLLLFQCLQLGICLPQGFFSGISPFSNKRTNDNSGNRPLNIRLKSPISVLFGRQKTKQNQYQIQSDYNKQNPYDNYKTNNGYREEVEENERIEYQNKNEEQNKVEVHSRTGAFDAFKNEQSNIGRDPIQSDTNNGKQIEEAKDPFDSAANEIISDITTESPDESETTTSTDDYETTTDDYGLDSRSGVNPNVVASLLG